MLGNYLETAIFVNKMDSFISEAERVLNLPPCI